MEITHKSCFFCFQDTLSLCFILFIWFIWSKNMYKHTLTHIIAKKCNFAWKKKRKNSEKTWFWRFLVIFVFLTWRHLWRHCGVIQGMFVLFWYQWTREGHSYPLVRTTHLIFRQSVSEILGGVRPPGCEMGPKSPALLGLMKPSDTLQNGLPYGNTMHIQCSNIGNAFYHDFSCKSFTAVAQSTLILYLVSVKIQCNHFYVLYASFDVYEVNLEPHIDWQKLLMPHYNLAIFQLTYIKPLSTHCWKKPTLDKKDPKNFRPVSNLFTAKVIEKYAAINSSTILTTMISWTGGGGVLTLTWYTYMCLPFGALFCEIWYSDRGVFIRDEGAHYINWVYFGQIIVKSTQFDQNWVLFFRKWYTDGWEIWQKIGIEIVRFSRSGRHIHVRFWWKNPPPGLMDPYQSAYRAEHSTET